MGRKKFLLALAAALSLYTGNLFAQNSVSGLVTDQNDEPVIAAFVMVSGKNVGTSTNEMGEFRIEAAPTDTLVVDMIGYKKALVPVQGRSTIYIKITEDTEMLEGTVVVGYGSAQKIGNIVGSVKTVSAENLVERPSANLGDALQGQVAGLQIFSASGEPSSGVSMTIRGNSSINMDSSPLVIIDGVPANDMILSSINPQDIENISILKDASATAIYGSRAASGVIVINTKQGKKGERPTVSLRAQRGVSFLTNYNLDMMNSEELIRFEELCRPDLATDNAYQARKAFILGNGIDFDWTDYLFDDSAPLTQVDATVRGASENSTYYVSGGYYKEDGTAKGNSGVERFNFRSNIDINVAKWFKLGANLALTYSKYQTINTGWYYQSPIMQAVINAPYNTPYRLIVNEDGSISKGETYQYYPWDIQEMDILEYYRKNNNDRQYIQLTGQISELFTPIEGLNIRFRQSVDGYDYTMESKYYPSYYMNNGNGSNANGFQRYYMLGSTNTIEYKKGFGDHFMTLLLGEESILKHNKSFNAVGTGLTDDRLMEFGSTTDITSWGGSNSESTMNSFFFNADYSFRDKYFFNASVRSDGSSLFGKDYKYARFFSVGAMWKLKQEQFLQNAGWISDLNVSLSYGTTGNSSFDNWYPALGLVGSGAKYNGADGWALAQMQRDDLTWETVAKLNLRIDGRLWDRLGFDIQLYDNDSRNLLMQIPLSAVTGFGSNYGNVGDMTNKGVEAELSWDIVHTKNLFWQVKANINYNRNEITRLFNGITEQSFPNYGLKYQVGKSSSLVYTQVRAGVDPADGLPMWYDLNGNKTKIYSDDIMQFWGDRDSTSPWSGGFSTNLSWKNLAFAADFAWIGNRWIFIDERYYTMNPEKLLQYNFETKMLDIWTTPGQETDIPKYGTPYYHDTARYSNASFLRLKNVSVSWSLPSKWLEKTRAISAAKIYATGRNLLTFTGFEGYDPEVGAGNATSGMYPNSRQIVVGIDITF